MSLTRRRLLGVAAIVALTCAAFTVQAHRRSRHPPVHFVPDSQEFWDFSKNWTTNLGPAYRDTVPALSYMLPCTGKYALCFESGPAPLPCELTEDGRFANCTCTVEEGLNFVLLTAILNHAVYQETIDACGTDGSKCRRPDSAPVCRYLRHGRLIPGAELISTFSPDANDSLAAALQSIPPPATNCDGPFAGCMTAPCVYRDDGTAECSCPVFDGHFTLTGTGRQCTLTDSLLPSASYAPALDPNLF
jgi:hypothetical protein